MSDEMKIRSHVRTVKSAKKALTSIEQLIADHEALLKVLRHKFEKEERKR